MRKRPKALSAGPVVVTPPRLVLGPQNECPRLFRRSRLRVLRRFLSDARSPPPPRFALQPAFHYGFIPLIIVVGMSIKQDGRRPTLAQLLSPM